MSDADLETAFIEAVDSGNVDSVRRLLAERPDLIKTDFGGITPLHAAAGGGNVALQNF